MTAVGKQQDFSTSSTDADDFKLCSPCKFDGENRLAAKYCVECKEYLCESCCSFHKKVTLTKKHVLVNKEQMEAAEDANLRKFQCPEHEHTETGYHCPTHGVFGCYACFYAHQKACRDMERISEVAEAYMRSDDVVKFNEDLKYNGKRADELIKNIQNEKETVKTDISEAKNAIDRFKRDIIDKFETLETQLKEKLDSIEQTDLRKLNGMTDKAHEIEKEFTDISTELEILQNRSDITSLYIATVKARENMPCLADKLQKAEDRKKLEKLMFEPNYDIVEALHPLGLGQITRHEDITQVEFVQEINAKMSTDSSCNINNIIVMPDDVIFMSDYANESVKLYKKSKQSVISSLKLSSKPWSAAVTSDFTVVVSLPELKTLVFINACKTLSETRKLEVDGKCYGVDYDKGKLVVSFAKPDKIEVMSLEGQPLQKIYNESLRFPANISLDPHSYVIYVSNYDSNTIVSLTVDGVVTSTYKDNDLVEPRKITITRAGIVFVCSDKNNIHQLTRDCTKVKVLLTKQDGLYYTRTICYDDDRRLLYVGSHGNIIKVFRLIYEPL